MLVGINARLESPLLNLRISRLTAERSIPVFKLGGSAFYSAYKVKLISNTIKAFFDICEFKHAFCKNFYIASFSYKPFILVSGSLLFSKSGLTFSYGLVEFVKRLARVCLFGVQNKTLLAHEFCYFGFLHQYSTALNLLSAGVLTKPFFNKQASFIHEDTNRSLFKFFSKKSTFIYLIGCDTFSLKAKNRSNSFLVYQGAHGMRGASNADLILPSVTYVEKVGIFRNILGTVQRMEVVVKYLFGAKSDLEIFHGLTVLAEAFFFKNFFNFSFNSGLIFNVSLLLSTELILDSAAFFYNAKNSLYAKEQLRSLSYILTYNLKALAGTLNLIVLEATIGGKIFPNFLESSVVNYYGDDSFTVLVASRTMSLCSNLSLKKNFSFSSTYY